VANRTFLSESRCRPFRPVRVRLDRNFDRFLRERRQINDHIFESSKGGVQIKILDVNDKEFGAWGGNDTIDEDFCRGQTFELICPLDIQFGRLQRLI
jgi:hypothetical protein